MMFLIPLLFCSCHTKLGDKLLNRGESSQPQTQAQAPQKPSSENIPVIMGYDSHEYYGLTSAPYQIFLEKDPSSLVQVHLYSDEWRRISSVPAPYPYYSFDPTTGIVEIHNINTQYYWICQWTPKKYQ